MKRQKTTSFWAMLKNLFFWRFLHENGMKRNPIHAAETHISSQYSINYSYCKNSVKVLNQEQNKTSCHFQHALRPSARIFPTSLSVCPESLCYKIYPELFEQKGWWAGGQVPDAWLQQTFYGMGQLFVFLIQPPRPSKPPYRESDFPEKLILVMGLGTIVTIE